MSHLGWFVWFDVRSVFAVRLVIDRMLFFVTWAYSASVNSSVFWYQKNNSILGTYLPLVSGACIYAEHQESAIYSIFNFF